MAYRDSGPSGSGALDRHEAPLLSNTEQKALSHSVCVRGH